MELKNKEDKSLSVMICGQIAKKVVLKLVAIIILADEIQKTLPKGIIK